MPKRLLPWMALCACSPFWLRPRFPRPALQQLAADPYWIALGHYERGKLGGWRSYVDDERFFLADNGESHPDAELAATLKALYASPSLGDKHAQCVYRRAPAGCASNCNSTTCRSRSAANTTTGTATSNPHSAVLVFPAAYLNSPSSMFGHTLLRIDQADVTSNNTALLSYALNFGAYIEGMDNSILYAWKGLMGGYPGLFALVPVPGEAGRIQPPGEPRPLGIQAEPHARGDRAHGRTTSGNSSGSASTTTSSTRTVRSACSN